MVTHEIEAYVGEMKAAVSAVVLVALAMVGSAQSPAFEAASIKLNTDLSRGIGGPGFQPSQYVRRNIPIDVVLTEAFGLRDTSYLVGVPEWNSRLKFDIVAKMPTGTWPSGQRLLMLQALLRERFGMRARRETREMPVYALRVARGDAKLGPSLHRSDVDCKAQVANAKPQSATGAWTCGWGYRGAKMIADTQPLKLLETELGWRLDRPVLEETGLSGAFSWTLDIPDANTDPSAPSLFTAVQEQLGLKLEPTRAPRDIVVIEHLLPPTSD